MYLSREIRTVQVLFAVLVAAALVLRILQAFVNLPFSVEFTVFVLFVVAVALWGRQVRVRTLNPQLQWQFIMVETLLILWLGLQTWLEVFTPATSPQSRFLEYLDYLPGLFIPLLLLLRVLALHRRENEGVDPRWTWLFVPTTLLLVLVLTNDLHGWVFRFPTASADSAAFELPAHGWGYYLVMVWILMLTAGILAVFFRRAIALDKLRLTWAPMIPLLVGMIYSVVILGFPGTPLKQILSTSQISCLVFVAFVELLFDLRFIPSNDNYRSFWEASSLRAGILNQDGVLRYRTPRCAPVSLDQAQRALQHPILMDHGNSSLRAIAVPGGIAYWHRDLGQLKNLKARLENLGDVEQKQSQLQAQLIELAAKQWEVSFLRRDYALLRELADHPRQELYSLLLEAQLLVSVDFENASRLVFWGQYLRGLYELAGAAKMDEGGNGRLVSGRDLEQGVHAILVASRWLGVPVNFVDPGADGLPDLDSVSAVTAYAVFCEVIGGVLDPALSPQVNLDFPPGFVAGSVVVSDLGAADSWRLSSQVNSLVRRVGGAAHFDWGQDSFDFSFRLPLQPEHETVTVGEVD